MKTLRRQCPEPDWLRLMAVVIFPILEKSREFNQAILNFLDQQQAPGR